MRILNRYILVDYLLIFVTALGLITFVMTVGALIQAVDLMSRGISPDLIIKFFLQNIPYILSFSMPISTLFAALLLFGRLSMDNEISAMKACGISLGRLVAPLVLLSVLFSGICVYINCEVAPEAKYASRRLLRSAGVEEPINLLEEGRFINDFPGLMIYVARKNGNIVKDVVAYELTGSGTVKRSVRAREGEIIPDDTNKVLLVKLYDVRIEMPDLTDPHDVSKTTYVNAEVYPIKLDFKEMMEKGRGVRKRGRMTVTMMMDLIGYADWADSLTPEAHDDEMRRVRNLVWSYESIAEPNEQEEAVLEMAMHHQHLLSLKQIEIEKSLSDTNAVAAVEETAGAEAPVVSPLQIEKSRLTVETNRRISTAVACFTFMLIGIPLGVKSHRKETSIGMVMSLAIVFVYYLFIIAAKALADYPALHPNLILWIPLLCTQFLGLWLIRRSS